MEYKCFQCSSSIKELLVFDNKRFCSNFCKVKHEKRLLDEKRAEKAKSKSSLNLKPIIYSMFVVVFCLAMGFSIKFIVDSQLNLNKVYSKENYLSDINKMKMSEKYDNDKLEIINLYIQKNSKNSHILKGKTYSELLQAALLDIEAKKNNEKARLKKINALLTTAKQKIAKNEFLSAEKSYLSAKKLMKGNFKEGEGEEHDEVAANIYYFKGMTNFDNHKYFDSLINLLKANHYVKNFKNSENFINKKLNSLIYKSNGGYRKITIRLIREVTTSTGFRKYEKHYEPIGEGMQVSIKPYSKTLQNERLFDKHMNSFSMIESETLLSERAEHLGAIEYLIDQNKYTYKAFKSKLVSDKDSIVYAKVPYGKWCMSASKYSFENRHTYKFPDIKNKCFVVTPTTPEFFSMTLSNEYH